MLRMAKPASNLRLFVAIHPPGATVHAMFAAMEKLSSPLPPHRVTPAGQVHLTVQFIGDTPAKDVDATIESVERSAAGLNTFALTPRRLITLPQGGPARLVAMETDSPATLLELHRRLVARLARPAKGRRGHEFVPHLTMCRFTSPTNEAKVDQAVKIEPFPVTRITLMRSVLAPEGAVHHELAGFELRA